MTAAHYKVGGLGTYAGGTGWATEVLRSEGLDVGHEKLMKNGYWYRDGVVCGCWVWRGRYFSRFREHGWDNTHFDHVIRVVRHPLAVAETLHCHVKDGPWRHEDKRLQSLRHWVCTHEEIDRWEPKLMLRVGGARPHEDDWEPVARALGLDTALPVVPPRGHMAKNRLPRLTWDEWRERDPGYAERGAALCRRLELAEPPRTKGDGDD